MTLSNEQILELAKSCGFQELTEEKDEIDDEYWGCWEEQLLKFARAIHQDGYSEGFGDGRYEESYMNSMSYLGE